MTQNTEQNVRTRDDREQEIAIMLCKARGRDPFQMTYQTIEPGVMEPYGDAWCHYIPEAKAVLAWHEAEARGAEEQRRKDAEGQEAVYQWRVRGGAWHICLKKDYDRYQTREDLQTRTLYTRPANVAALEAEIASLKEAEQLARTDAEASKARVTVLGEALASLATACEKDFTNDLTECSPDEDAVGIGTSQGNEPQRMALTFGMIRRARAALTRDGEQA